MSDDGSDGKRDGMDRAERHADPHWWQCMLEAVKATAIEMLYFNTDDVTRRCQKDHPNASTHEKRAIGPLMKEACRLEYCEPTRSWKESTWAACHKRPKRTWTSLLYQGLPWPKFGRRRTA